MNVALKRHDNNLVYGSLSADEPFMSKAAPTTKAAALSQKPQAARAHCYHLHSIQISLLNKPFTFK